MHYGREYDNIKISRGEILSIIFIEIVYFFLIIVSVIEEIYSYTAIYLTILTIFANILFILSSLKHNLPKLRKLSWIILGTSVITSLYCYATFSIGGEPCGNYHDKWCNFGIAVVLLFTLCVALIMAFIAAIINLVGLKQESPPREWSRYLEPVFIGITLPVTGIIWVSL